MVWLSGDDLVRPEELLEQDHAGKLMRKGDPSQREAFVGPLEHAGSKTERTAHDKAQVFARVPTLLDQLREIDAGALASVPVQRADKCSLR